VLLGFVATAALSAGADDQESPQLPPVVVTGTRTPVPATEVPADMTVLTRDEIERSPALTLDDLLRQLPDFSTFRRSSSLVTPPAEDPEAQGVTLRGIGPGGASRALVLLDGVPINDAFGGWIYWNEIPVDSVERIEIARGGMSSLWGNFALGGVVNVITRPIEPGVGGRVSGGNRSTTQDAISYAHGIGPLKLEADGDLLHSGGWNIIASHQRGPIDQDAGLDGRRVGGRLEYALGRDALVFARAHYYDEERGNGTPLRDADASRASVITGASASLLGGRTEATVFGHFSRLRQTFSETNEPRTAEMLTQIQHVPSTDVGGALTWSRPLPANNLVTVGSDVRLIAGKSRDGFFESRALDERRTSRGQQRFIGVFLEDLYRPLRRLEITLGVRVDGFVNFDGRRINSPVGGPTAVTRFRDRRQMPVSPKFGIRYEVARGMYVRGAAYRAFRAPTLAELYRRSSVEGLALVENPRLRAESLDGGEIGFDFAALSGVTAHVTGYWNNVRDAIAAITTKFDPVTGEDAERTRINLGLARIRGVETELSYDVTRSLELFGRYVYAEPLIIDATDPNLEGKVLTQVPRHAGVAGFRYAAPRLFVLLMQTRIEGRKFEDPDNHDTLGGYYVIDAQLSRALPAIEAFPAFKRGRVFVSVQNLLDRDYEVDKGGGITKIGTPLLVLAGTTFRF